MALESFVRGGWFGRGPGEGTVKRILPESHTDFVFAVAAEEFGIVLCLVLLALFAFIVIRALRHALRNEDPFTRFAAAGLAILFGLQSAINMAVNLHLMPAKGMTLPFISYGGSSMISLAYGMGMLLALTRERPRAEHAARAPAAARLPAGSAGLMASRRRCARRSLLLAAGGTGGHLFPGRGAGRRRWRARRRRRSRDRRARRALWRHDFPARAHPRHPERDRARAQSGLARAHRRAARHRRRCKAWSCSDASGRPR